MLTASQRCLCPAMLNTVSKHTCCCMCRDVHIAFAALQTPIPSRRSLRCRARVATPRGLIRAPAALPLTSPCITLRAAQCLSGTRHVAETGLMAAGSTSCRWRRCTTLCTRSGSRTWAASSRRPTSSTTSSGPSSHTGGWQAIPSSHKMAVFCVSCVTHDNIATIEKRLHGCDASSQLDHIGMQAPWSWQVVPVSAVKQASAESLGSEVLPRPESLSSHAQVIWAAHPELVHI